MASSFLFNATRWSDWAQVLDDHGWRIAAIVILLAAAHFILARLLRRVIRVGLSRAASLGHPHPETLQARADSLMTTLTWIQAMAVVFIGVTLILDEVGVGVSALVAGVGLIGLALGLGTQALIRDVINGVFILVEDQYRVGDVVRVADVAGVVTEITPRRTVLRDQHGHVHSIPNGQVGVATNMTRGFSRINFDVAVAYEEDIARVVEVLDEVGAGLARDYPEDITDGPRVLRVDELGDDGVTLKVLGDVKPGRQWELTGELRRRVKDEFDRVGIEIPYRREVQVPWEVLEAARRTALRDLEERESRASKEPSQS